MSEKIPCGYFSREEREKWIIIHFLSKYKMEKAPSPFLSSIHRQMLLDLAKLCQFSHLSAANWNYYRHKKKVLHLVIILGYRGRNRLEFSHHSSAALLKCLD